MELLEVAYALFIAVLLRLGLGRSEWSGVPVGRRLSGFSGTKHIQPLLNVLISFGVDEGETPGRSLTRQTCFFACLFGLGGICSLAVLDQSRIREDPVDQITAFISVVRRRCLDLVQVHIFLCFFGFFSVVFVMDLAFKVS